LNGLTLRRDGAAEHFRRQTMQSNLHHQASTILDALAHFPGGTRFVVTAKRYPRIGPADSGTTYQERTYSCTIANLSQVLGITADADEVTITLEGAWPGPIGRCDLIESFTRILDERGLTIGWDVRARVSGATASEYCLTVFNQCAPRLE
jgi:hypothetical protein